MGNPNAPSSAPVPRPDSVLRDIYDKGADANLDHVHDGIDVQLEKKSAKLLNGSQRQHLAAQIEAWRGANKDVTGQKLEEKVKVLELLQDLKHDIDPPTLPRVSSEIGQGISNIGQRSVEDVAVAGEKTIAKVKGDWEGMWKRDVPVADKLLTGAKYVAGALGLVWLVKKINEKWNAMMGTKWYAQLGKILGFTALGLGGAKLLANTTDKTFGPRLSGAPGASPAPAVAPAATSVAPKLAKELANDPDGIVTPDGIRASLKTPTLAGSPTFTVDGRTFVIKNLGLSEIALARMLSVKEDGDHMEMNNGVRMKKDEFHRVVKALKESTNKQTSIMVTLERPDAAGVYKTVTRNLIFERTSAA